MCHLFGRLRSEKLWKKENYSCGRDYSTLFSVSFAYRNFSSFFIQFLTTTYELNSYFCHDPRDFPLNLSLLYNLLSP